MAGQFNIPGWDPTTMTYMQPTRSVASITQGASPEVLQTVKDMMAKSPSAMVQQATVSPEKAQILDQIFNRPKNIFLDTKPSVTSKELSSAIKEAGGIKPKSFYKQLSDVDKKLSEFYKKGVPKISKKGIATGVKAGNIAGKIGLPLAAVSTLGTLLGDNPTDEKVAAGLSLLGTAGMAGSKSPYVTIPSAILTAGSTTYPLWSDKVKGKLNELEANKQLAMANKAKQQPVGQQAEGSEEIIMEPVPSVGQWDGTRADSITNFVNGLTSGSNVQPNAVNQNVPMPEATQQQFVYQTPEARQDYINKIEQFANDYPALLEQDRRRQMQAALLAPVINNDRFVNAAVGQGQVDTTAKQLELLNTAANARVSEAQRPLLAQAFANAGMPAELAYASEDQLKSIVNLLVAKTNMDSARYKADVASQLGKYKADTQLEGVRIATAAKQGPEKLLQELAQAGFSIDEAEGFVERTFGPGWRNMIGTGTPIQFNLGTGQVQGPENIIFADE